MVLFTNTSFRSSPLNLNTQRTNHAIPLKPPPNTNVPRIPGLGYILFPSPKARLSPPDIPLRNSNSSEAAAASVHEEKPEFLGDNKPEPTVEDPLTQKRRELEAEEARKGEEDWVSSGGILRDTEGQRDWARTQAVREELKLREFERQIQERWDEYERRWSNIWASLRSEDAGNASILTFEDIPWPVRAEQGRPVRVEDLAVKRVEDFLLEGLTVRGGNVTKKDRVRNSLLRWHPDKLGNLLRRIHPDDVEDVMRGLGIVMECLQRLNVHG